MKLLNNINKTALCLAVEEDSIEIINLLLTNEKLDVNILNILIHSYFLIKFKIKHIYNV